MTILIDSSPYQSIYDLWTSYFNLFHGVSLVIILALVYLVFKIYQLKKINQQLSQKIEQTRETENWLKLVFEHSSDDLLLMILNQPIDWNNSIDKEKTLDYVFAHQKVVNINHSSLQQYGATLDQFLGLTPNDLFAHDLEQGRIFWRNLFDSGRLHQKTHERKLDGTPILIEGNYICFYDEEGRIKGHLRITPNYKSLKSMSKKAIEIDNIYQDVDTFFYSVSHDLRAPLRHINGFVNALKKELNNLNNIEVSKVNHYLEIIDKSSQKMAELIDGLLILSRIERRELILNTVSLRPLVETAINLVTFSRNTENLDFKIGNLPTVKGNSILLQQVFVNLIDNAVKFSENRSPAIIEIDCKPDNTIFVKDNGIGFSMEYADKIFGAFQRLHPEKNFPGTGIGLSIVQRIIHRHGGKIWAESEPEKGATFCFKLN